MCIILMFRETHKNIFPDKSYSLSTGKLVWVAWVNESGKFPKTLGLLNGPDGT